MKLYTPPEMSKKLVALGCVSQSGMFYIQWDSHIEDRVYHKPGKLDSDTHLVHAFEFEDFGSMENHSIKNRILMKKKLHDFLTANNWVEEVGRGL